MTTASHLASEHSVLTDSEHSAFYGLGVSEEGLHKLHALLHEGTTGFKDELVFLDHEYVYAG